MKDRDEWRYVCLSAGALSVTTGGLLNMPKLCAGSLDYRK